VRKIAFTGSTDVGKLIQRAVAGTGKRLTLELGGKAANIIFEDAPLGNAGTRCSKVDTTTRLAAGSCEDYCVTWEHGRFPPPALLVSARAGLGRKETGRARRPRPG
jgi:hypothetical protein